MMLCDYCRIEKVVSGTSKGFFCKYCINLPIAGSTKTFIVGADYEQTSIAGLKTPSDVKVLKDNLARTIISLGNDIASCPSIPDEMRLNWQSFRDQYQEFYNQGSTILSSDGDYKTALDYQDQIRVWQQKASFYCNLSAPILPDSKTSNPTINQTIEKGLDTARLIAIIGGVALVGIVVYAGYQAKKNVDKGVDFVDRHPELLKLALV